MSMYAQPLATLDRFEAMRLLRTARVGRIVYTADALPAIEPVGFFLADDSIVVHAGCGTRLAAAGRCEVVAFEADDIDAGWSVVVTGRAVEDADVTRRVPLVSGVWPTGGTDGRYIRISCDLVTGRRLGEWGQQA